MVIRSQPIPRFFAPKISRTPCDQTGKKFNTTARITNDMRRKMQRFLGLDGKDSFQ